MTVTVALTVSLGSDTRLRRYQTLRGNAPRSDSYARTASEVAGCYLSNITFDDAEKSDDSIRMK